MNYLFFDIENANNTGGEFHICEFGYVLTNDKFEEIESREMIINPETMFEQYVLNELLVYSEQRYLSSPPFPIVFEDIKRLFEMEDTKIIGHTTQNDVKYLNSSCRRYGLPFMNYDFYDIRYMYGYLTETYDFLGLEHIANILGVKFDGYQHRALDDAMMTMRDFKAMCKKYKANPLTLLEECEMCQGSTNNGVITVKFGASMLKKRLEEEDGSELHYDDVRAFHKNNKYARVEGDNSILTDKAVLLTKRFIKNSPKLAIGILKLFAEKGIDYTQKASAAQYFVTFEYEMMEKDKERMLMHNDSLDVMSPAEFYEALGTTEDVLLSMPLPDIEHFLNTEEYLDDEKKVEQSKVDENTTSATLGDLFKKKGWKLD